MSSSFKDHHAAIMALAPIVANFLKGKKREKFETSIQVLLASLVDEQWSQGGSRKAGSGFYQGLTRRYSVETLLNGNQRHQLTMCLDFGHSYTGPRDVTVEGIPQDVLSAWITLCNEARASTLLLYEARPKPVITTIGLSPKVTKTLKECDLDIELPTIKMPPLEKYYVQAIDKEGKPIVDHRTGKPVMDVRYRILWTKGVKFGEGRFGGSNGCQACGKPIPSGRFVPIEAQCKNKGLIALWIGCDCARNIFGVKDLGLTKDGVSG